MDSPGSRGGPWRGRPLVWLLALAALFLAVRLLTILTAVEHAFIFEEVYRGTIARELVDGLKMPLFDYQADPYSGGSIAMGLVAAPFFFLFGPSLFSLKCAALLFSLAAFVGVFILLNRFFSLRAAVFASLLYVFCPTSLTQLSLLPMGFHSQAFVFNIFTLLSFYEVVFGEATSSRAWPAVLFGVASGLGISFTYITAITPLTCLLCWFLWDRRFLAGKSFMLFLAGLAAGMVPWLIFNATHHFDGIRFAISSFTDETGPGGLPVRMTAWTVLRKLLHLGLVDTPRSLGFPPAGAMPGRAFSGAYAVLAAVAAMAFAATRYARGERRAPRKYVPLFLYPAVFLLAYSFSRYHAMGNDHDYEAFRYLSPLHFWAIPLLGVVLDAAAFGPVVLAGLLALGMYGQSTLVWQEPAGKALAYKGYSYYRMGQQIGAMGFAARDRASAVAQWSTRYAGDDPRYFNYGLLAMLPFRDGEAPVTKLETEFRIRPSEYHLFLFELMSDAFSCDDSTWPAIERMGGAAGRAHFLGGLFARTECVVPRASTPETLTPDDQKAFYLNVGQVWFREYAPMGWAYAPGEQKAYAAALLHAPERTRAWIYEGAGRSAGEYWVSAGGAFDTARHGAPIDVPAQYEVDFMTGVGWGIRHAYFEDPNWAMAWIDRLPPGSRRDALAGVDAWRKWYGFSR